MAAAATATATAATTAIATAPSLPQPIHDRRVSDTVSRFADIVLTCVGLVLLSPLLLALAIIVRLDSPGPVIYRRRVMGKGGTQFDAFKFRTMLTNGDEMLAKYPELKVIWERDQKLKEDPRVTRCGGWMRKLSLDELPQLFNVLIGQMALVGPRMITKGELSRYGEYAEELLTVKPGLTGLWQISGRSNIAGAERAQLDIYQIRTRSFLRDLLIVFKTIPAVIKGRGAY